MKVKSVWQRGKEGRESRENDDSWEVFAQIVLISDLVLTLKGDVLRRERRLSVTETFRIITKFYNITSIAALGLHGLGKYWESFRVPSFSCTG